MSFDWERIAAAMVWATQLHREQTRKGTNIPYISHPIAVASLVLEAGGSEPEVIAALLHDVVEDQGVDPAEIQERFGPEVAAIVAANTDSIEGEDRGASSWKLRKQQYLEHLSSAPAGAIRVSLADKVHNARCVAQDYLVEGDKIFERFNGKKAGTLWYYAALVEAFSATDAASNGLVVELRRAAESFGATPEKATS